jgi:hypothetical protein
VALTQEQLDAIIADSDVSFEIDGATKTFTKFAELKEFIDAETSFWQRHHQGLDDLAAAFARVQSPLEQAARQTGFDAARKNISEATAQIRDRSPARVYSTSQFGQFLAKLQAQSAAKAMGAYAYHNDRIANPPIVSSREKFDGVLSAFAFHNPDVWSHILASSVESYRIELAQISKRRAEIDETSTSLKEGSQGLQAEIRKVSLDLLEQNKRTYETTNAQWANTYQSTHDALKSEIDGLLRLYHEQLRLKEPAAYWDSHEKDYTQKGNRWAWLSIGLTGVLFAMVAAVLYCPPDFLNATSVSLSTIKGSLLLAVAVSTLVYLIHTCVRLALSSHHLARDAKERYQLTHVFLSLIQKEAIKPEDRNLILAALFSRADTGLLKHDGGPTMPNPLGQLVDRQS